MLVPLTRSYSVRDLARDLALPVVVAAPPGLGTINHTLLTLEAVRSAALEARGVVLTPWPVDPGAVEAFQSRTRSPNWARSRWPRWIGSTVPSPARWPAAGAALPLAALAGCARGLKASGRR